MQARNFKQALAAAALLAALPSIGQATSYVPNFSVPGVPLPGNPNFDNTASITLSRNSVVSGSGYTLTSVSTPGSFVFQPSSSSSYNVTGTFSLSASFSSAGAFTGGTVAINGTIPTYSGPGTIGTVTTTTQNLFSADLTAYGADNTNDSTPFSLGFKTENFSGWASQFSAGSPESVYLYSFNVPALTSKFGSSKFAPGSSVTFQGAAFTTVPVPSAVWLLGSAFALAPWARRKNTESV